MKTDEELVFEILGRLAFENAKLRLQFAALAAQVKKEKEKPCDSAPAA